MLGWAISTWTEFESVMSRRLLTWSNLQCCCYSALTRLLGEEEDGGI